MNPYPKSSSSTDLKHCGCPKSAYDSNFLLVLLHFSVKTLSTKFGKVDFSTYVKATFSGPYEDNTKSLVVLSYQATLTYNKYSPASKASSVQTSLSALKSA